MNTLHYILLIEKPIHENFYNSSLSSAPSAFILQKEGEVQLHAMAILGMRMKVCVAYLNLDFILLLLSSWIFLY
jgi:hypothetical protein